MTKDIDRARAVRLLPIAEVAASVGIPEEVIHPYGRFIAKVEARAIPRYGEGGQKSMNSSSRPKLVLVTAVSPTPAGEGKTTTSIGLADGLRRLGKRAVLALREPSLGPCFGMKGCATGGGMAQIAPMEQINLHFTGDLHAIGSATNLLAALIDNHIHWGNGLGIDVEKIFWRRALDLNDRSLRHILQGLEAPSGGGVRRESGFDITAASETMAVFCLSRDIQDLEERLSRMIVAESVEGQPVTVGDLRAEGAMTVLLKDALMPNLVQTLERTPAFVHGGPFANIAHGCNSIIATQSALAAGEIAVTEAGFGADLGAEKFCHIASRYGGFEPDASVLVATVRAMKMHGGVPKKELDRPDTQAVLHGIVNLERHIMNLKRFGLPVVVALNSFPTDTKEEEEAIQETCERHSVSFTRATHWAEGGKGAEDLAQKVLEALKTPAHFQRLYTDELPLFEKIKTIASSLYGAGEVTVDSSVFPRLARWEEQGYASFPVCMAKTPASFSTNPALLGAPSGHTLHVRDVRLSAGAGFVVALCGDVVTMPGLSREPAANSIGLDDDGQVKGLS